MKQLPARPSLEYLRKEAKQLLDAARSEDSDALERLKAVTTSGRPSLHHAQLALAREYGCASWRDLTVKVRNTETDAFLKIVCGDQWDQVEKLKMPPETVRLGNIFVAAACGDVVAVDHLLQKDSRRAKEKGGPDNRTALSYLCFSRWNHGKEALFLECARMLLVAGADPNSNFIHPSYPDSPLPPLYGAAGVVFNRDLVSILLEHGAEINDNESLYHSTESRDHSCLEVLLEHKPRFEKTNAGPRMLDFEDVEGLKLLLDAGYPVNEEGTEGLLNHAIRRGRSRPHIEMLLEYGADVTRPSTEGLTPYWNALRNANVEAAEVLRERGFAESDGPKERFMSACLRSDLVAARAAGFDVAELSGLEKDALIEAAWNGWSEIVQTMLDAGFPIDHLATHGGHTALHAACWKGYADIADFLVKRRAPLEVVETTYQATPIGWAIHGSMFARGDGEYLNPEADYPRIVRRLLVSGAKRPEEIGGSPDVQLVLAADAKAEDQPREEK